MSTQAIFSKDYYNYSLGFNDQFHLLEKKPDGSAEYGSNFFDNLWKHRFIHTLIDNQGTISTIPFSFFDDLARYFRFSQDSHLIAVHQRLKYLESQLQNPLSAELQHLRQEIHREGYRGANLLKHNIQWLSSIFEKANQKSTLILTLLKTVNFFRKMFHLPPIEFYTFAPIDQNLFVEKAIQPALQLAPQQRTASKFLSIIQNQSPFALPAELNSENLQKLEFGLLDRIHFQIDQKHFSLSYNPAREEFLFSYMDDTSNRPHIGELMDRKETYSFRSQPMRIEEKKLDGSRIEHSLQHIVEFRCERGAWYEPFKETYHYQSNPGEMALSANREYTIALSQGNLCLKLYRRVL